MKNKLSVGKRIPVGYTVEPVVLPSFIIPYYINTSRLTDLYAIKNGGYSEYVDLSQKEKNYQSSKIEGEINAGAKIFKIADVSSQGNGGSEKGNESERTINEKIYQTAASMLQTILESGDVENIVECADDNTLLTEAEIGHSSRLVCVKGILTKLTEQQGRAIEDAGEDSFFWKRRMTKIYNQLNGIPDRAPVVFEVRFSNIEYNLDLTPRLKLNALLSKEYLYQCQLDDMWDMEFNCLGKILVNEKQPRIEIIALFC